MAVVLLVLYRIFMVLVLSIPTSYLAYRFLKNRDMDTKNAIVYGVLLATILMLAVHDLLPNWNL